MLNNVSDFKDNVYELSKPGWSEVQTDWSNYTNEEKELVKSRNPLLSTCSTQAGQLQVSHHREPHEQPREHQRQVASFRLSLDAFSGFANECCRLAYLLEKPCRQEKQ